MGARVQSKRAERSQITAPPIVGLRCEHVPGSFTFLAGYAMYTLTEGWPRVRCSRPGFPGGGVKPLVGAAVAVAAAGVKRPREGLTSPARRPVSVTSAAYSGPKGAATAARVAHTASAGTSGGGGGGGEGGTATTNRAEQERLEVAALGAAARSQMDAAVQPHGEHGEPGGSHGSDVAHSTVARAAKVAAPAAAPQEGASTQLPAKVQAILDMCQKNPALIKQMLASGALDAFPPVLAVLRNLGQTTATR